MQPTNRRAQNFKKKANLVLPQVTKRGLKTPAVVDLSAEETQERSKIDFQMFFATWAVLQGWEIPAFHFEVMDFLSSEDDWAHNTGVLQVFRGAGKSTILGLFIVYKLVTNPTTRFLVLSADHQTAQRISQDCRSIIQRHPLAVHLYGPEVVWREHTFSVRGHKDARNPNVATYGMLSNITSARADYVICDDVEVPKNCMTEDSRRMLRMKIQEATHILVPGGKFLFIGTPHAYESIYPEIVERGASSLKLPLLTDVEGEFPYLTGRSRWQERFNEEDIQRRQVASTRGNFLSQYQLMAVNTQDSILDPSLVKTYSSEIFFSRANGVRYATLGPNGKRIASVSAFWDPSLSKARGDNSVLSIVFSSDDGHYYIHRAFDVSGTADEQCEAVKRACIDYQVPIVRIETNGIGALLPQLFLKHTRGTGIGVEGVYSKEQKSQRIIEAFEAPLAASLIYVHEDVINTPFLEQLRDFDPKTAGFSTTRNDFIDATASAIRSTPIRIGRGSAVGSKEIEWWGEYAQSNEIEVEYATTSVLDLTQYA